MTQKLKDMSKETEELSKSNTRLNMKIERILATLLEVDQKGFADALKQGWPNKSSCSDKKKE
jgi:galactokinase/mevalonate kinase-like predicted kinase